MLQMTIKTEYAIRIVIFLAMQEPGKRFPTKDIAASQDIPKTLLPKIFQDLSHKGIIKTIAGRRGGAILNKKPKDITILEIIEATDGRITLSRCLTETNTSSRDESCPIQPFWEKTRNQFTDILKEATIAKIINTYYKSGGGKQIY
jgi:Rrf2 family protein